MNPAQPINADLVLSALVIVPAVSALLCLAVPRHMAKFAALLGSVLTGMISMLMLANFDSTVGVYQFVESYDWFGGISWSLGVDGISLFLVVLAGLLFPIAIAATETPENQGRFYSYVMMLLAGSMGAFLSLDLILFFAFFEVVLVPMYFLIGGWGHGDRIYAAMKFFLYTMAASALMLVGILALGVLTAGDSGISFHIEDIRSALAANPLSDTAAMLIFVSFMIAFAAKVPVVPVHTWLPDAHTEAPTIGSVILAGVMLKLGTYGMIRFGLALFPEAALELAPVFLTLGVVGIVYGAAVATVQKDLKRLVAYSSIAHMGFIVLGIFAFNSQGISGAVIQMVNHGISTGALFILVGWIYARRHTRQIAELSGLQKAAPVFAGVMTLVVLSSIGLPGLNGFVGEFLILMGAFNSARWWAVVAVSGVILAALYLLWAYQRTFHGSPEGNNATMPDLSIKERLAIAPLLVMIIGLGVYPNFMLERIEPTVDVLIASIEEADLDSGQFIETEPEAPASRAGKDGLIEELEKAESKSEGYGDDHGGDS